MKKVCSEAGCKRPYCAKGLCHKHYQRQWYLTHPGEIEAARERMRKVPRATMRDRALRYAYGVDTAWYNAKLEEQDGVCAIHGGPETATIKGKLLRLAVDHCHDTGKPRALLCRDCNRAIGLLRHDPVIADAASTYLRTHS
jgi:hypothetical protein